MSFIRYIFIYLVLTIIMFSTSVFASTLEWEDNSVESKEYGSLFSLLMFENRSGLKNIAIVFPSDDCNAFSSIPMEAPSMYINNTKVQMMAQCISKNMRMDFPKTSSGINYLVSELKNKNIVIYKQGELSLSFNTKGFTKSYNNFESTSGGL